MKYTELFDDYVKVIPGQSPWQIRSYKDGIALSHFTFSIFEDSIVKYGREQRKGIKNIKPLTFKSQRLAEKMHDVTMEAEIVFADGTTQKTRTAMTLVVEIEFMEGSIDELKTN